MGTKLTVQSAARSAVPQKSVCKSWSVPNPIRTRSEALLGVGGCACSFPGSMNRITSEHGLSNAARHPRSSDLLLTVLSYSFWHQYSTTDINPLQPSGMLKVLIKNSKHSWEWDGGILKTRFPSPWRQRCVPFPAFLWPVKRVALLNLGQSVEEKWNFTFCSFILSWLLKRKLRFVCTTGHLHFLSR